MISNLQPYPEYKESALPWSGQMPEHWETRRLRHACEMRVSNVDKHAKEGEIPVRLCNYVDVYKNECIFASTRFMTATATEDERARFRIRKGDVLITKDSEEWNDIGVPSLVQCEAPDLVCGYHLAILRPRPPLLGPYLHRAIQCHFIAAQFHVEANGVTRYGLSHGAIECVVIPLPPPEEQSAIVRFLDYANGQVERAIRAKKKVIALLNEQKEAITYRTVKFGLDPDVHLKPSGLEWLGDLPEHWEVRRAKDLFREVDIRSTTGTEVLLSLRMYRGLVPHNEVSTIPITSPALIGFKKVTPGQIVMNRMRAAIGMFGVVPQSGLVSPDYAVLEPGELVEASYFLHLFKTRAAGAVFRMESKGLGTGSSGFMRLYTDRFGIIKLPIPPRHEQRSIVQGIATRTAELNRALDLIIREISLLREYRTRLIADVVTGKLDVRDAARHIPAEVEKPVTNLEGEDLTDHGDKQDVTEEEVDI